MCTGFDGDVDFSVGAKFPEVHDVLQWATQRTQAELVVSDVKGRDCHQLLQEQIHTAGGHSRWGIPPHTDIPGSPLL